MGSSVKFDGVPTTNIKDLDCCGRTERPVFHMIDNLSVAVHT